MVLPGERRSACRSERAALGIPLAAETVADLEQLAAENEEFRVFIHERGAREDREKILGERLDEKGKQIIN